MSDLISKTDALTKIRRCYPSLPIFKKNRKAWQEKYEGYIKVYEIIQNLPTAEPKTGHWIMHIDDLFPGDSAQECSVCHEWQFINGNDDNYCPNCGAKMKEEDNEYTNKRKF